MVFESGMTAFQTAVQVFSCEGTQAVTISHAAIFPPACPPARPAALPVPYAKVQRIELRDAANGKQITKITSTAPGLRSKTKRQSTARIQSFKKPSQKKKTVCCYWKKKSIPFPPLHTLVSRYHHVIDFADHRKCTAETEAASA
jgi:hypothetical protein